MQTFSFDAAFSTHHHLKHGITERHWSRIVVAADSDADAHDIAARMALGTHPDLMLTALLWRL